MPPSLSRACCALLAALLLAAPEAEAAPSRTKSSRTKKTRPAQAPPPPAPAPQSEPVAPAASPAPEETTVAAAPTPPPPSRKVAAAAASKMKQVEAPAAPGNLRIGVGGDLFGEGARMSGQQGINASVRDESFDYGSAGFLSATAWLSRAMPSVSERLRVGAGLRLYGNYATSGGRQVGFGLLQEAFLSAEYGLPIADQDRVEVLFAGRAGLALLVPGREFEGEILRLREQGVDVWNVPRVGWLLGPSVGVRRRMSERIWLRADLLGQVEQLFLFATSQEISGLRFTKNWSTL
ncbi:MAG TPA: hypothetical protein VLQ93_07660, partial [Myxococcaceae bacterium]|nr:hypothetical protein [Myxococcaceae bacterium]